MSALLVIDAAAGAVAVGIVDPADGRVCAAETRALPRGQVEALLPMIAQVQMQAGVAFADLAAVAATVGPGSFTGIRLGLAAARGIGLAAGCPVFGLGSFAASLAAFRAAYPTETHPRLIVLDSKRRDVFAQAFTADNHPLTDPQVLSPQALRDLVTVLRRKGPICLTGDAADLPDWADLPVEHRPIGPPPIAVTAALACDLWRSATGGAGLPPAAPLYLRPPDAAVPAGGGVLANLRPDPKVP